MNAKVQTETEENKLDLTLTDMDEVRKAVIYGEILNRKY